MGLIRAAVGTIGGTLADQWLEAIEPAKIDNTILATYGVSVSRRKNARGSNRKGTEDVISNGSIIHVPENVFMLLVDGGKIISATDQPGYYQVDNSRSPSIFFQSDENVTLPGYNNTERNAIQRPGGIVNTLKDSWERFKFGGTTPLKQRVIYINKQGYFDFLFDGSYNFTDGIAVLS
jgi:membrane protease subunit (stomatin/prohibitin family)